MTFNDKIFNYDDSKMIKRKNLNELIYELFLHESFNQEVWPVLDIEAAICKCSSIRF